MALQHWHDQCSYQAVLLMSDSPTTVSYIRIQGGGTGSPGLGPLPVICLHAADLSTSTFTPATFQTNATPCLIPYPGFVGLSTRRRLFPTAFAWEWSLGEDPQTDPLMTRWNYSLPPWLFGPGSSGAADQRSVLR